MTIGAGIGVGVPLASFFIGLFTYLVKVSGPKISNGTGYMKKETCEAYREGQQNQLKAMDEKIELILEIVSNEKK